MASWSRVCEREGDTRERQIIICLGKIILDIIIINNHISARLQVLKMLIKVYFKLNTV